MMDEATTDLPAGFECRLPAPQECSLGLLLQARALSSPDETFVVFEDGEHWSAARAFDECARMARTLAALGVERGDTVMNWLPNGRDHVRVLFAASMLGAIEAPLNVAYRGSLLSQVLELSRAKVMVSHPALVERLDGIDVGELQTVLLPGVAAARTTGNVRVLNENEAPRAGDLTVQENQPWDVVAIIFTSGTTGPSKGAHTTYAQQWTAGRAMYPWVGRADRMLVHHPLFHIAAMSALYSAITVGGSVAVTEIARAQGFWDMVRRLGVTAVDGLGAVMAKMLCDQPPQPNDREHGVKMVGFTHVDAATREFARRFGVDVVARFSMTETSCVTTTEINPAKDRTVGRVRKGMRARIVDEHDMPVVPGAIGELVVRSDLPWVLSTGYLGNPQATAQAWHNGWFHTGDLFRRDEDGDLFYVGRLKDSIRRRGENISAYEVELEILSHPAVSDVAVIGVGPADDQEVLAVILPKPDAAIDPAEVLEFLRPRLAHFMLPRFIRLVRSLPKTETGKVRKGELREQGLGADVWDREAAGIIVRRQRLDEARADQARGSHSA